MKPAVAVQELTVAYGRTLVLREISFAVQRGEFFVIIGPNGSGKTTLMKSLTGAVKVRSGRIEIFDRRLQSYSRKELARNVAVVAQHVPNHVPFTVAEVVLMGRSPHLAMAGWEGRDDIRQAEQAMTFTNIAHLAHRKVHELSGGERQRVFIARAVCQQPRVILLDEPTASLDLAHQIQIMDLMERLRKEMGITVIMASHDLNLAALYGDRILLLDEGRLVQVGTPGSVMTRAQLEKVFQCKLLVDENPLEQVPRVLPIPDRCRTKS